MALKKFVIAKGLDITVYKRRASRSLRLSIAANGDVRVTMPLWLPYKAGVAFAESRLEWIQEQRQVPTALQEGQLIGKGHTVHFRVSAKAVKTTSRLTETMVIVTHPLTTPASDPSVQAVADKAAIRALRQEASKVLPPRLSRLATEHNFTYTDVTIKQLTSRWGSCDQHHHIALNLYLMQLPWELIDYVLLHELVHTQHLHHGADFWGALETVAPSAKKLRSAISKHKPVVLR